MVNPEHEVRLANLLPYEFQDRLANKPILYIPLGSIEWHSYHMPFGVDGDKAEEILARTAARYGGIVAPAMHYGAMHGVWRDGTHPGLSDRVREEFYTEVLRGYAEIGFKVFACVSGHWTSRQTGAMNAAIAAICGDGSMAGFALFDGADPYDGFPDDPDLRMDHAGQRETSIFMYLFPDRVRLHRLTDVDRSDLPGKECHLTASGIQGLDPLIHADPEIGRRHVEKIIDLIGAKATQLLSGLRQQTA